MTTEINTDLMVGNLYCLIHKGINSGLMEYMKNQIINDFHDFENLGIIHLPSNTIFKNKDTKEVSKVYVTYSEPIFVLEKFENENALMIMQTNNGETNIGYIFFSHQRKPLLFEEYYVYGRLNISGTLP